jgi:hypothetical protein
MKISFFMTDGDPFLIARLLAQSAPTFLTVDTICSDLSPASRRTDFIAPSPTVVSVKPGRYDPRPIANIHRSLQCLISDAKRMEDEEPASKMVYALPNMQRVGVPNCPRSVMVVALSKSIVAGRYWEGNKGESVSGEQRLRCDNK